MFPDHHCQGKKIREIGERKRKNPTNLSMQFLGNEVTVTPLPYHVTYPLRMKGQGRSWGELILYTVSLTSGHRCTTV